MNKLELTGRVDSHIRYLQSVSLAAEESTVSSFLNMKEEAEKAGIVLSAFSSFRDYKSQMGIWNSKYTGQRPLYNSDGEILDYNTLSPLQVVFAVLSWSALPGASRHHWGTEIDVIDTAAVPDDYEVKLIPEEYKIGGIFYRLHGWLEENMDRFGFFKPYREFRGGVCEEPWHLSYAPVSKKLITEMTIDMISEAVSDGDLLGKEIVLELLPDIYQNYILNVCE